MVEGGRLTPRLCPRRSEIARDGQSEAVDRRQLRRRVRRQPAEANSGSGEGGSSAVPLQRLKMATNRRKFKMMLKIGPTVLQKSDLPLQFNSFYLDFNVAFGGRDAANLHLWMCLFYHRQSFLQKYAGGEKKNTFHSRPVGIPSFYIQDICFEVSPPNMKNSLSGVLLFLMKCCKSKCIVSSERNWKRINVFTPTPVGKCPVTHVRRWYQIRCRLYLQHTGVNKCVTGVYEGSRVTI